MTRTRLAKAPYDQHGSLINYVGSDPEDVHEWRENKPFPTMLILTGTTRGMSAARLSWRSDRGRTFEMFLTDAAALMQGSAPIYAGSVDTWWIAQRRGSNYGIRQATQDDLKFAGHTGGPKADCKACDGVAYGYESWCPLPPTPDKPHQFRPGSYSIARCLCGERLRHAAHPGHLDEDEPEQAPVAPAPQPIELTPGVVHVNGEPVAVAKPACSCSRTDRTACSSATCQG
ncbi:hypothetical protein QFZ75_007954 [Streptomyces sp. V3I8]|uniref:hypothetical protein n=1 Tax=Streptomyces sp. V3I8 TaxID=3042279 RepID=UPI0027878755|nr:hypothetical protein [Streptomyces sp. V3I8]MDQ1041452.1 hypothetical protein [Streptomyces sp. V3I8]